MIDFLVRKILSSLLTLLLLTMIVFFLVQVLMPGDYVSMFIGMPLEQKELLRQELGLDLPVWLQYFRWLTGVLTGRLGTSFSGTPVLDAVRSTLPPTLLVFLTGGGIAFLFGHWLGKYTEWRRRWWVSEVSTLGVIGLYAFFPPALTFLLGYLFGNRLGWLPSNQEIFWYLYEKDFPDVRPNAIMSQMVSTLVGVTLAGVLCKEGIYRWKRIRLPGLIMPLLIVAGWIGSWFALGIALPALRLLHFAALPILAFSLLSAGEITILTRVSLAETLHEEYINTARAKGLTEVAVRDRHATRNALLPVVSKAIVSLPYLIAGLAIVEYSLQWNGLGSAVFYATLGQDVPLALGYLLFIGLFAMGARLLLESVYLYLDPRIRSRAQAEELKA